ncbi:MAG: copper ABC transporter ATP-binding protein [Betaproteobacteria bacterium HGW-Betaproteobacteria-18]|nr:MAG: copper ABC transporter ATP-binding protein [Betaproteobacteria bacterium HGW-Betaproteobacteria-18]
MVSKPAAGTDPAIETRAAVKHYGAVHAVDGVDLTVARGEIFGLIGHNGAGKSTLFKMMLGLIEPSAGQILVNGVSVAGRDFRAARRSIGYLPENVVLYDNLSGLETLRFFAKLKGAPSAQCEPTLARVGLADAARRPVREYSKGMRQRLGFAQALLGAPRVLFLDEPTNGLDPQAIRDFYAILHDLQDNGVTILITSHILAELQERVNRLAIMAAGRIQAIGSVQALRDQMQMPLVLALRLAPHDVADAQAFIQTVSGATSIQTAEGLHVSCPRQSKMVVLGALAGLGTKLLDLDIQEPSLEDVFFGFSD